MSEISGFAQSVPCSGMDAGYPRARGSRVIQIAAISVMSELQLQYFDSDGYCRGGFARGFFVCGVARKVFGSKFYRALMDIVQAGDLRGFTECFSSGHFGKVFLYRRLTDSFIIA